MKQVIKVEYCPKCGWLLRAAWYAQEILTTFSDDIEGVMLKPGEVNGVFSIYCDQDLVFDRKTSGRFPEIKELKQLIRDRVNPGKDLGHADRRSSQIP